MSEAPYTHCKRCQRKLMSPESQMIGYGRVCAEKVRYMQTMDLITLLGGNEEHVNDTA